MGMLSGSVHPCAKGFSGLPIRIALICLGAFLIGKGPANAADLVEPEPTSYTYFNVEGGYANLDGEDTQAFVFFTDTSSETRHERSIDLSDAYYGRIELGRVWDGDTLNGIGAYVQGWDADQKDISETEFGMALSSKHNGDNETGVNICTTDDQPCARGEADLDRSLIEVGLRFFHAFGDPSDLDGISAGIEPFVAFISEDTNSTIGNTFNGPFDPNLSRSSNLDATAYGAFLALDGRHHILERTVLTARAAAGVYYTDAEADTSAEFFPIFPGNKTKDDVSSDFAGFRGQLALGLEQMLTETLSIGVIGRLDYWSDYPTMEWTDYPLVPFDDAHDNRIASEDFLVLSIGARVSVNFR